MSCNGQQLEHLAGLLIFHLCQLLLHELFNPYMYVQVHNHIEWTSLCLKKQHPDCQNKTRDQGQTKVERAEQHTGTGFQHKPKKTHKLRVKHANTTFVLDI